MMTRGSLDDVVIGYLRDRPDAYVTTRQISRATNFKDTSVRGVLMRLVEAGVVERNETTPITWRIAAVAPPAGARPVNGAGGDDAHVSRRLAEHMRMMHAQDRLIGVLRDAFTRAELQRMFDALPDVLDGADPMHALTYAVGNAWADYEEAHDA